LTRPRVLLSVAASVDGYIDDTSPHRLMLSNAADFDRVDQLRADCDAIMVGAETLRRDNPRLIVKDPARQATRRATGRPANPRKVTVSGTGNLDPDAKFWHIGIDQRPIVYTTDAGAGPLNQRLGELAEVVSLGATVEFAALLDDLGARGVAQLMVEGGTHLHTALLSAGLADALLLAIGPVLVGDSHAPRFTHPATYPGHRMRLVTVEQLGDVALLHYQLTETS